MTINKESGDWKAYRQRFALLPEDEIDFHFGRRDVHEHQFYGQQFDGIEQLIIEALQRAQAKKRPYIMFTHGWSTSRPGKMTARSVIRGIMRSSAATPFIDRSGCIQHESVFVAKVRLPR